MFNGIESDATLFEPLLYKTEVGSRDMREMRSLSLDKKKKTLRGLRIRTEMNQNFELCTLSGQWGINQHFRFMLLKISDKEVWHSKGMTCHSRTCHSSKVRGQHNIMRHSLIIWPELERYVLKPQTFSEFLLYYKYLLPFFADSKHICRLQGTVWAADSRDRTARLSGHHAN